MSVARGGECAISCYFVFSLSSFVSKNKEESVRSRLLSSFLFHPLSSPNSTDLILFVGPFLLLARVLTTRRWGQRQFKAETQEREHRKRKKIFGSPLFANESLFLSFFVARERASAAPRASRVRLLAFKRWSGRALWPCSLSLIFSLFFSLFLSLSSLYKK